MLAFLRHLHQRWNNWCGDAEMERAIRRHLSEQGYYGGSAKLRSVRLAAVKRPGWLQVYLFEVTAKVVPAFAAESSDEAKSDRPSGVSSTRRGDHPSPGAYHELFGLVREDHRHDQTSVRVFTSQDERREQFDRWSEGLVQLRGGRGLTCS